MIHGAPLPSPDHDTKPFWDGCREGKFLIPRCRICGTARWPPGPMCPVCRSDETRWALATGSGQLYSWVIVHHPANAEMAESVPYAVGLIALAEGIRVVGNVHGCQPEELVDGLRVELFFEEAADGFRLPNFRRAGD